MLENMSVGFNFIAMDVSAQVYTTNNILMSIQIVSTGIDVIRFATAILTVQFCSKLKLDNL